MKIQVLGSGCAKCKKQYELVRRAVSELGLTIEIEYLPDAGKIVEMGLMQSPVIAVDGKPIAVGFVASVDKLKELIRNNTRT